MKKIIILIGILFALQTALIAQNMTGTVVFNLALSSTLNLKVVTGTPQAIAFVTAADYNNGVVGPLGVNPGFTTITVEATQNWHLMIRCPDFTGTTGPIVIDNLGVYCAATGTHQFGTEVTCTCLLPVNAMGLNNADVELIGNGTGNMGDATDNAFTLNWEMGTMHVGNIPHPMHATSMFDQMAANNFVVGTATTTATLTLIGL